MRTQQEWLLMFYSDSMYAEGSIGSVDEMGFYALTCIGDETEQRATMNDLQFGDIEDGEDVFLREGWYVVEITSGGNVWGHFFGSEELEAKAAYDEAINMYELYYEDEEAER